MPQTLDLKYGCNPNQTPARVLYEGSGPCPIQVRNGSPSFINVLDALRGWQLVRELAEVTGKPAAASFKHVSPAGVAVAGRLSEAFCKSSFLDPAQSADLSPLATAYAKARSSDRGASFGDFVAVSHPVDATLAQLIKPEVSDGIIAPGYDGDALALLSAKKGGKYVAFEIDPTFDPDAAESRVEFGLRLEQPRNAQPIDAALFGPANLVTENTLLDVPTIETALVATVTLKHTQSNSVALGWSGQAIGIGAGQQSRIACTRLACDKADRWFLKQHPKAAALQFKDGVKRSDKVNALDQFVMWNQLGEAEKTALADLLAADPEPITPAERIDWLDGCRLTLGPTGGSVVLSSDAFFPFRDNLDCAVRAGVGFVVQAGGSQRDGDVIRAADEHNMAMAMTGVRLFLH